MPRTRSGEYRNCEVCGGEFYVTPTRLNRNKHHTCSLKCMGLLNSKLQSKKITVNCCECSKPIKYKLSHIKKIKNPTCSRECCSKFKSKLYKADNPRALNLNDFDKYMYNRAKSYSLRSKDKGLECDIDYKFLVDLYNKQNGKCYYTGIELRLEKPKQYNTLSLDRLDSSLGYTKDNVVWCINAVNMLKSDYPLEIVAKIARGLARQNSLTSKLKVEKVRPTSKLPQRFNPLDAGYDLFVDKVEDCGSYLKVYSGVKIEPELGLWFMLVPRSSIFKKGLTMYNNVGIIDQNFRGEIVALLYKTKDYTEEPKIGDRVVQLIPQQQYEIELVETDTLTSSERASGGFGSSGA